NSSTFPSGGFGRRWLFKWAIASFGAVCMAISASAIDPNRTVSQYLHDSWGTEKGFPGGSVSSIAQTADGYLWIGTDRGVVRFDGLNFRQFEQANSGSFVIGPVRTLLADSQANLWILLQDTKLFRYHDGTFELVRGEAENGVTAMALGNSNKVVLSSVAMGALIYDGKQFLATSGTSPCATLAGSGLAVLACDERSARFSWSYGNMPDRLATPTSAVTSIAQTADGRIWLGSRDWGLFALQGGRLSRASNELADAKINCLLPLQNSEMWMGTSK